MTSSATGAEPPSVLVRADAGRLIGSGHVVRSLTIARAVASRGMRVTFATRDDSGALAARISREGHDLIAMPGEAPPGSVFRGPWDVDAQRLDLEHVVAESPSGYSAVIVDHYGLDAAWERGVRALSPLVLALDDLANRPHDVEILIDQNWYGPDTESRYDGLVPEHCIQLLGPRYAPLQPAYADARADRAAVHVPPQRILVSFGGADPTGETLKVVAALQAPAFDGVDVDVVLGNQRLLSDQLAELIEARPDTNLHIGLPTLAGLLGRVDLAVGASGSATWERACLGVPALVTTTSAAHSGVTAALADAGMTIWAGLGGEVSIEQYRSHLARAMSGEFELPPPLADGLGAARIAEMIAPTDDADLVLREATNADEPLFLGGDVGGPGDEPKLLGGPGAWHAAGRRFARYLSREDRRAMVAMVGGTPVGRVYARLEDGAVRARFDLDDFVTGRDLVRHLRAALARSQWTIRRGVLGWQPPSETDLAAVSIDSQGPGTYGSQTIPASSIAVDS